MNSPTISSLRKSPIVLQEVRDAVYVEVNWDFTIMLLHSGCVLLCSAHLVGMDMIQPKLS